MVFFVLSHHRKLIFSGIYFGNYWSSEKKTGRSDLGARTKFLSLGRTIVAWINHKTLSRKCGVEKIISSATSVDGKFLLFFLISKRKISWLFVVAWWAHRSVVELVPRRAAPLMSNFTALSILSLLIAKWPLDTVSLFLTVCLRQNARVFVWYLSTSVSHGSEPPGTQEVATPVPIT